MPEDFTTAELVIPGTYIRVRAEGLIGAGGISTGNIGIVGTALHAQKQQLDDAGKPMTDGKKPVMVDRFGEVFSLTDYAGAKTLFGEYDAFSADPKKGGFYNLTRSLELLYLSGARTIYAVPLEIKLSKADPPEKTRPALEDYTNAFAQLIKEDVNILIAPELSTDNAKTVFSVVDMAEAEGKDAIAVIGSDSQGQAGIVAQAPSNDRQILCAPGIHATESVTTGGTRVSTDVILPGTYTAAVVAGLLSGLTPQTSPTNKVISGVEHLATRFSYSDMVALVKGKVLVLEERRGVRVVRGLTTDDGAFSQVTTRRITDFAKAGIRLIGSPFIGRLNNERIRKVLQGAIDGFLTTMVQDEALTSYRLEVTATRTDEINGRAIVNVILQPTFSIDFIAVTMVLQ